MKRVGNFIPPIWSHREFKPNVDQPDEQGLTPLHRAIISQNTDEMFKWIDDGAVIMDPIRSQKPEYFGMCALNLMLHNHMDKPLLERVRELAIVQCGGKPEFLARISKLKPERCAELLFLIKDDINLGLPNGKTLLQHAAWRQPVSFKLLNLARALIAAGADTRHLNVAEMKNLVCSAIEANAGNLVATLMKAGYRLTEEDDELVENVIKKASLGLLKIFVNYGFSISDYCDRNDGALLFTIARHEDDFDPKQLEMMELLLEHRAPINRVHKRSGNSALTWSLQVGNKQALKFLCDRGADWSGLIGTQKDTFVALVFDSLG